MILAFLISYVLTESVQPKPVLPKQATVRKVNKFDGLPTRR